jgi:pimeloyl-ACP methyl ester carboxylesterase
MMSFWTDTALTEHCGKYPDAEGVRTPCPEAHAKNIAARARHHHIYILTMPAARHPDRENSRGRKLLQEAGLVVMDDCGRRPQCEKAEEFNQIHIDFLAA